MRSARHGLPRAVIARAVEALEHSGLRFEALSPTIDSAPLGPSRRQYANAAAVIRTVRDPGTLLGLFKQVERTFGRRVRGRRWGSRVLDLDIILWAGGTLDGNGLLIPHPEFRNRAFVLGPAAAIAPRWRDPVTGLALAQLRARLTRPRPVPSAPGRQATRLGP